MSGRGMRHPGGGGVDMKAIGRYTALLALADGTPYGPERERALALAERYRARADLGYLRAFVPPGAPAALSMPDRYVVLVDDVPWWRAHLALLCASFAGFEDLGGTWEVLQGRPMDYGARLVGPPEAVEVTRRLYAAASFAVAASIPRVLPWASALPAGSRLPLHAWCWGAVAAVQDDLAQLREELDREERERRISDLMYGKGRTADDLMAWIRANPDRYRVAIKKRERPRDDELVPEPPPPEPLATAPEEGDARTVDQSATTGASPRIDGMLGEISEHEALKRAFAMGRVNLQGFVRKVIKGPPMRRLPPGFTLDLGSIFAGATGAGRRRW